MPKKLPKDSELLAMFKEKSIEQIAAQHNVKYATVQRRLAALLASGENLSPEHHEKIETIKRLQGEGKSWRQIAKILNVPVRNISAFAARHGLTKRPVAFALENPIGCHKCVTNPFALNLCFTCYARFRLRLRAGKIQLPTQFVLIESDEFKVICHSTRVKPQRRFEIHCKFFNTIHKQTPTPLEIFLLQQIFRTFLIELDRESLLRDYDALASKEEDRNAGSTP